MAWRIHENVVHGEIDNRERGVVRGRLWLAGLAEPIVLELKGNASSDLAGCLLTFENLGKPISLLPNERIASIQRGTIGDLTASRKVRVFDMPVREAYARLENKLPVPERIANCLYLEWYSESNGRVVIESTDYKLTISAPCWRLTPEEEQERAQQATDGFSGFMQKLTDALDAKKIKVVEDKEWNEFDYEKFLRESDARADKYIELLDKYLDHPDRDQIIDREMGSDDDRDENTKKSPSDSDLEDPMDPQLEMDESAFEDFEDEPEPNPATKGVDWIRDGNGEICHPLCDRANESVVDLFNKLKELGLQESEDPDLRTLRSEYQITSAKLAGALNGVARGCNIQEGAFIVACLKRALGHLYTTQGAFQKVAAKKLLPPETVQALRSDLSAIREEILNLMEKYRSGNP